MTTTATKTYTEYQIKAIKSFRSNFNMLMACMHDYESARKAAAANNRTHGYEHNYGDDGYVQWNDRNSDWRAVDTIINDVYDRNSDIYAEAEAGMTMALSLLDGQQRKQVADLVVGFLSELDTNE